MLLSSPVMFRNACCSAVREEVTTFTPTLTAATTEPVATVASELIVPSAMIFAAPFVTTLPVPLTEASLFTPTSALEILVEISPSASFTPPTACAVSALALAAYSVSTSRFPALMPLLFVMTALNSASVCASVTIRPKPSSAALLPPVMPACETALPVDFVTRFPVRSNFALSEVALALVLALATAVLASMDMPESLKPLPPSPPTPCVASAATSVLPSLNFDSIATVPALTSTSSILAVCSPVRSATTTLMAMLRPPISTVGLIKDASALPVPVTCTVISPSAVTCAVLLS